MNINKYAELRTVYWLTFSGSIFIVLYDTCKTKVSNFAHQALINQNVGSSQVSVNVVLSFDVGHAFCNLDTKKQVEF